MIDLVAFKCVQAIYSGDCLYFPKVNPRSNLSHIKAMDYILKNLEIYKNSLKLVSYLINATGTKEHALR